MRARTNRAALAAPARASPAERPPAPARPRRPRAGVNSDFRVLVDGMMHTAFERVWRCAPGRTLSASILFKIPFVRSVALKTGCVDASRPTAERCLRAGHSVLVLPGGELEQLETICGRERVYLKKRAGFVRLAIVHGTPLVPAYVFGSSDLYHTSRALHGLRVWISHALHIAIPLYWGRLGLYIVPSPVGFPRRVPQQIVFGDPIRFETQASPTKEYVAACHAQFVDALERLFDAHKAEFGYADRSLEVL